jgi:hypothetical protein
MSMFFLMCSERCGSNFITKLLNGHSKICGPSTKHIINPLARNLFRYQPVTQEQNWEALLIDIHRLMSVSFSIWKKSFSLDELRNLGPAGDVAALIRNIFYEEAKANGKQHVFIKENQVYEFLPYLLLNFPESKYIYQTRDPRDMALSWKKNLDHPGGIVKAARQWQKDQQNSLKNYDALQPFGKAYFLRYEDLIANPARCLKDILHFLGLNYETSMLDFHKDELTQINSEKQKAWGNLSRGVIADNKNKYLNELSEHEIKAIEKICYYEMIHLGYEPRYALAELDALTDQHLLELEMHEQDTIPHKRSEGVKGNMDAKKIFYTKIL